MPEPVGIQISIQGLLDVAIGVAVASAGSDDSDTVYLKTSIPVSPLGSSSPSGTQIHATDSVAGGVADLFGGNLLGPSGPITVLAMDFTAANGDEIFAISGAPGTLGGVSVPRTGPGASGSFTSAGWHSSDNHDGAELTGSLDAKTGAATVKTLSTHHVGADSSDPSVDVVIGSTAGIKFDANGHAVSGILNSFSFTIDGETFSASGLAINAHSFFVGTTQTYSGGSYDVPVTLDQQVAMLFAGNDHITGANITGQTLLSGAGNDVVTAVGANTVIVGSTGNDVYNVHAGDSITGESIAGGGTDNVLAYLFDGETYIADEGIENLVLKLLFPDDAIYGTGNTLNNVITGALDANNGLSGLGGNDTLLGFGGNDTLDGGTGNDSMSGGAGDDTYYVDSTGDKLGVEALAGGNDHVFASANFTLGANYETLTLGDTGLKGTGGAGDNSIAGGAGNDSIDGGAGNDTISGGSGSANSLAGGAGNDFFFVTGAGDTVDGGAGIDTVQADGISFTLNATTENLVIAGGTNTTGTGNALGNVLTSAEGVHTLIGGLGNDTYHVQTAGDTVDELTGGGGNADLVIADTINYTLGGGLERLTMVNGEGATGQGNELDNVLSAGDDHAYTLIGGAGNDTYNVNDALQVAQEIDSPSGGTADLVVATLGDGENYTLLDGVENLTLVYAEGDAGSFIIGTGNAANNSITGAIDAANFLQGSDGDDTLRGGAGNDTLEGGGANDSLIGGAGDDHYIFSLLNNGGIVSIPGLSRVADSGGTDTLVLEYGVGVGATLNYTLAAPFENLDGSGVGGNVSLNITGTAGANLLIGGLNSDVLNGGAGNDTLDGGAGVDALNGGLGDDSYVLALTNTIHLFEGFPQAFGDISLDTSEVSGDTGGSDTLVLVGGAGNPSATPADNPLLAGTVFTYTVGANTLDPFENVDASGMDIAVKAIILNGTAGNNRLIGGSGNDTVTGNGGNDTLGSGFGGDDSLVGGTGNDTYLALWNTQIGDTGGKDAVIATLGAGQAFTLFDGLENLTLAYAEMDGCIVPGITGTGNGAANLITGASVDDEDAFNILQGLAGNDTLLGGIESDSLNGGADNDSLVGGAGADTLDGGTGKDSLAGGLGDDTYKVNLLNPTPTTVALDDTVTDTGGIDTLVVTAGESVFIPAAFKLTLAATLENLDFSGIDSTNVNALGNASANIITGNGGNNVIDGGAGNDSIDGGFGNDTLVGGTGDDTFDGGVGDDTYVIAQVGDSIAGDSDGNDTVLVSIAGSTYLDLSAKGFLENVVFTGTGNAVLIGNDNNNALTGGAGNDSLFGEDGNDSLVGGAGADTLDGGGGIDNLSGGAGNDLLLVDDVGDVVSGGAGNDTVVSGVENFQLANDSAVEGLVLGGSIARGTGSTSANVIIGNASDNTLSGGGGNDILTGGDGNDLFSLEFILAGNVARITDFVQGHDHLGLNAALGGFTPVEGANFINGNTVANTLPTNGTATLLYVASSGSLYYDANGTQPGAPVLIATFDAAHRPFALDSSDFVVGPS